jgi:hypothetical protein
MIELFGYYYVLYYLFSVIVPFDFEVVSVRHYIALLLDCLSVAESNLWLVDVSSNSVFIFKWRLVVV